MGGRGRSVLRAYLPAGHDRLRETRSAIQLSPRERDVLQLLAQGKSNKEVAAVLKISVKTVETHRSHLLGKLNLHSIGDLVRYAIRHGIVPS